MMAQVSSYYTPGNSTATGSMLQSLTASYNDVILYYITANDMWNQKIGGNFYTSSYVAAGAF